MMASFGCMERRGTARQPSLQRAAQNSAGFSSCSTVSETRCSRCRVREQWASCLPAPFRRSIARTDWNELSSFWPALRRQSLATSISSFLMPVLCKPCLISMILDPRREDRAESSIFGQLVRELEESGFGFRFQARGRSMLPTIRDGDMLQVERVDPATLRVGDIVFFRSGGEFKAHRVIRKRKDFFLTRGDAGLEPETISRGEIVGKIVAKECAKSGCRVVLQGTAPRLK